MHTEDEELVVNVKFKVADILRYNASVAWKSLANKIVLALGVLLVIFYIYKWVNRTVDLDVFIAQNVLFIMVPVLIFILIPWRVWKVTLGQLQIPAFAYGVTYSISKEKIAIEIEGAKEEVSWEAFIKVMETKKDFRLFADPVQAQLLPKHNFTQVQIETFKKIATEAMSIERCKFRDS